ncbi:sodium-dependent dopamine transporter-like [Neodiprion fabricii]|uniref:sodium-dependent dopamine transporter-like n=1 Tax=Neodiprion fabricii TaxID=2872261 RepID=UPI001ED94813|nr:sodium-dependent dopamine transporter-like [Neodiprion fabricii]
MNKTWGWLKQLTRFEEQIFRKAREPIESAKNDDRYKSYDLSWSLSDLVLVTACFQIDTIYFCDMSYMFKNDFKPGFIQMMVMYATWGPALIYMEVFLGQYVRHGCLYLKNIVPLTCSTIGYGMLLTIYLYSVASVERLADTYMFFFRSFSSELPWMICPEGSTPATCIDRPLLLNCYLENRKDECYPKLGTELLSSRIYYKLIIPICYLSLKNERKTFNYEHKQERFLHFCSLQSHSFDVREESRPFTRRLAHCVHHFETESQGYTPSSHIAQGLSVAPFFNLRISGLLNVKAWLAAFKDFLRDHAIVRGGYQLIGCRIKPGSTTANLTICSCALTYMISVICQMFSTGILGVLLFYMKVTNVEEELYFPEYAKLFNFYPFALGMLPVRQVWSLIYFMFVALLSTSYTIGNMAVLEESIYDNFPVVLRYRSYVKVAICTLGFLIGVLTDLMIDNESDAYEDEPILKIGQRLTIVALLILTISVGYVYGVEQFSDDINFLNGSQPNTYWKICWKSLPFGILV